MLRLLFGTLLIIGLFLTPQVTFAHEEGNFGQIDVFHEVLEYVNETSNVLTRSKTEEFLEKLFHNFKCEREGPCEDYLCVDVDGLFSVVGSSSSLTEEQFLKASVVLLYYIHNITAYCKQNVDPSSSDYQYYEDSVLETFLEGHSDIEKDTIDHVLEHIKESVSHEHHDHGDDHGHEHEDEHAHEEVRVMKEKCVSADSVLYQLREEEHVETAHLQEMTSFIVYQFLIGSHVEESCRILPSSGSLLGKLYGFMGVRNKTAITETELEELLRLLGLYVEHDHEHDHEHGHEEEEGHVHDHKRRRRSVEDRPALTEVISRVKRQTGNLHDHGSDSSTSDKCYNADEIKAIHGLGHDDAISESRFLEICPTMLYMQVSNSCVTEHTPVIKSSVSTAERYGYSSLAILIICLTAVAGAMVFPLSKGRCYQVFMALFLGLAVSTLSGDALLHLLPAALGVHNHEDGHEHAHDHGSGLVIEEYVYFSLVVLAGLYVFYLVETLMIIFVPGHSHSDASTPEEMKANKMYNMEDKESGTKEKEGASKTTRCTTLAFMVIVGDAIHNFVDGLAVGASFSLSITAGITTSIAIFCHELPHELGDFAVLLKSGMTVKRALFWNFFSALTAFLGLYVGLSFGDDPQARRWVFAFTTGLFLYISLVDIFPVLVNNTSRNQKLIFFMNNVGILMGFLLMFLVTLYEENVQL